VFRRWFYVFVSFFKGMKGQSRCLALNVFSFFERQLNYETSKISSVSVVAVDISDSARCREPPRFEFEYLQFVRYFILIV